MAELDDKVIVTKDKITTIADTIRETGGTSARMTLDEMPDNIRAIGEGGGNVVAPLFIKNGNNYTCNLTFAKIEEIYAGTGDTKASMPQLIYSGNDTRSIYCNVAQENEDAFSFDFNIGAIGISNTGYKEKHIVLIMESDNSIYFNREYTLEYQKPVVAGDGIELENVVTGINRKTQISVADALMIIGESNGSVASIDDGADDIPLKSCIVAIEPVQSGSGDPSPSNVRPITGWTEANVTRDGFNLFDENLLLEATNWSLNDGYYTGTMNDLYNKYGNGIWFNTSGYTGQFCMTFTGYMSGGSSGRFEFQYTDGTTSSVAFTSQDTKQTGISTIGKVVEKIKVNYSSSGTVYVKDLCINISDANKNGTYEPYQGNTYNIEFPSEAGTVYGGTLDVTNGVLTVTDGYIASYNGETLPSTWISSMDVYAEGTTPTTGAEVVYKLATPQTYNVTPTEVKTLLGINNIFADCGDVDVEYVRDATLIINKLLELVSGNNNRTMMKSAVVEKTDEVQEQKKDSVEEDLDA